MVCIIIDDTDKIESGLIWQTFRNIRDQIWKLRISIIISVLPNQVSEITKPPLDHFFAYQIKLSALNDITSRELIMKRVRSAKVFTEIDEDLVKEILRRTDGNPQSTIDVFKQILEDKKQLDHISKKDIEKMGIAFLNKLSDIDRSVCNYILHNGGASASDSIFAKQIGVSRSRLAQILNKLRKRGIVGSKKDGRITTYFVTENGLKQRKDVGDLPQQEMICI